MSPDITAFYTNSELREELDITFQDEGWYKRGNDVLLITYDDSKLCVMMWNDRDPRPLWRKALSLPCFRLEGEDVLHKEAGWLPPMD